MKKVLLVGMLVTAILLSFFIAGCSDEEIDAFLKKYGDKDPVTGEPWTEADKNPNLLPALLSAVILNGNPSELILTFNKAVDINDNVNDESAGWRFELAGDHGQTQWFSEPPNGLKTSVWKAKLSKPAVANQNFLISYQGSATKDLAGGATLRKFKWRPVANRVGKDPDTTAPTLINAYATKKGGQEGNEPYLIVVFSETVVLAGFAGEQNNFGWSLTGNSFATSGDAMGTNDSSVWALPLASATTAGLTLTYDISKGDAIDISGNSLESATKDVVDSSGDNTPPSLTSVVVKSNKKEVTFTWSEPVLMLNTRGEDSEGEGSGPLGWDFGDLNNYVEKATVEGIGTAVWTMFLQDTFISGSSPTVTFTPSESMGDTIICDMNANIPDAINVTITVQ